MLMHLKLQVAITKAGPESQLDIRVCKRVISQGLVISNRFLMLDKYFFNDFQYNGVMSCPLVRRQTNLLHVKLDSAAAWILRPLKKNMLLLFRDLPIMLLHTQNNNFYLSAAKMSTLSGCASRITLLPVLLLQSSHSVHSRKNMEKHG